MKENRIKDESPDNSMYDGIKSVKCNRATFRINSQENGRKVHPKSGNPYFKMNSA